ncbi:hypothetical protein GBA63_07580 [Rubrobacter tropicus]|uniref:Uncharacterized protein n=1 Tax=Rubrobacter tropicus TaxID=2653851 RepID=A0A6G8Q7R2_9ACTN|nr:hypothetical protein [Rubrobacter tropicus]QIN82515.1 hypothetical protein GBA63_07580 [Rubrobacter tropicus]
MADRQTKERKLVALMINDLEASMGLEDLSRAEKEVQALPEDELDRILASRLDLPHPTDEEALDSALLHVREPETPSGSPGDLTGAPDMSHNPGPGENTDN